MVLIGLFFIFIGIDDGAAIHEKLGGALERMAAKKSEEQGAIEDKYFVTHTFKVVEEVLEMLGTTLLWVGFMHYVAAAADGVKLKLFSCPAPE